MAGDQEGLFLAELSDQLPDGDDLFGVEAHRRLVEHQNLRVVEDRCGQTDTLSVALGQSPDDLVLDLLENAATNHLGNSLSGC